MSTKKEKVRCGVLDGSGGTYIEDVVCGVKCLDPKLRGRDAWTRRVRMTSLVVRSILSAFPFCGEVCGHERQKETPLVEKKEHRAVVRNSPHCHILGI
jgi:hypothetical protein